MTGRDAAEQVLHRAGLYDVRVEHMSGNLTDHYDPRSKVLRLSDATYDRHLWRRLAWQLMSAVMQYSMRRDMCR